MKYITVKTIKVGLYRIYAGNTNEHRTGTPALGLLRHYFHQDKFAITPEQIQPSMKRPDFSVERLENQDKLIPHLFMEIKGLINSNFNDILDQLHDTVLETVDSMGADNRFTVFVIAMKGAKIAFFVFHSCVSLLDEYNIPNYKGFIPLGHFIPAFEFFDINQNASLIDYLKHINKVDVPYNKQELLDLGVESTSKIKHPHIWDLLNEKHENYVHNLFRHMAENNAGKDIED
jgi:hypothetical protein